MRKIFLVYGLTCVGKSTFCEYAANKYKMVSLHIRRLFEEKYSRETAHMMYRKMLAEHGNCHWLSFLTGELTEFKKHSLLVIEGFFTMDEAEWCANFFEAEVHIIYMESELHIRIDRKRIKKDMDHECARLKVANSDEYRSRRNINSIRNNAEIILRNNTNKEEFEEQIDMYLNRMLDPNYPAV